MDRRRFFSIVAGAGVGVLLPLSAYRYMMHGTNVGYVGVKAYLKDGPLAALRAITPNDDFYLTSSHGEPRVDPDKWSLTIDGLVDHPQRFSYDEIRKLPPFETMLTLECISNPVGGGFVGNASWHGTELRPLLDRAGIKPQAKYVALYAAEGYSTGHTLERILHPENFLAWQMNGEPLPRQHGFPLRIFIPGKYGMKMPKWLTRIEFVDKEYLGYWEWQGWSNTSGTPVASGGGRSLRPRACLRQAISSSPAGPSPTKSASARSKFPPTMATPGTKRRSSAIRILRRSGRSGNTSG